MMYYQKVLIALKLDDILFGQNQYFATDLSFLPSNGNICRILTYRIYCKDTIAVSILSKYRIETFNKFILL